MKNCIYYRRDSGVHSISNSGILLWVAQRPCAKYTFDVPPARLRRLPMLDISGHGNPLTPKVTLGDCTQGPSCNTQCPRSHVLHCLQLLGIRPLPVIGTVRNEVQCVSEQATVGRVVSSDAFNKVQSVSDDRIAFFCNFLGAA